MEPMKAAVSVMKANGGRLSGAKGTRSSLQPSTWTKRALRGDMMPQGMAITIDIETGVASPLIKMRTFLAKEVRSTEGTGVMGWWKPDRDGACVGAISEEGPGVGRSESIASTGAVAGIERVRSIIDVKEDARDAFRVGLSPPV